MAVFDKQRPLSFDSLAHYHLCVQLQKHLVSAVSHFSIERVRELLDILELHGTDICNRVDVPELVAWCSENEVRSTYDEFVWIVKMFISNYM